LSPTIWIIGEGTRDVGRRESRRGEFEGDLPRLLFRISQWAGGAAPFGYHAVSLSEFRRDNAPVRGRPTRAGGPTRELRAVIEAVISNARPQAIVAVIDARPDMLEDFEIDLRERLEPIAHDASVPLAVGFAVHEIEAWLLADPYSRRSAFQDVHEARFATGIEKIDDPKSLWAQLDGEAVSNIPDAELARDDRRRLAWASMRPDEVRRACPLGFAPFLDRLERTLLPLLIRHR
jgi:hypothetical protein